MSDRITVDVSELSTLAVDLTRAAAKIGPQVNEVMRKTAADVEATAKAFCPVDTGNLRNSIGHSDLRALHGVMEVEIGPTANYAHFVEFGTSRHAPQAFMGPALDRHTPAFVTAMTQLAEGIIR